MASSEPFINLDTIEDIEFYWEFMLGPCWGIKGTGALGGRFKGLFNCYLESCGYNWGIEILL